MMKTSTTATTRTMTITAMMVMVGPAMTPAVFCGCVTLVSSSQFLLVVKSLILNSQFASTFRSVSLTVIFGLELESHFIIASKMDSVEVVSLL